ncbi:MAG TPA: PLDc N-terminal domain-containing protein [Verrucomicrobiae bacterium]|nr:PLDc N-terminal domain-containing protein [Verrucomicrobiae bacterium]
MFGGIEIILLVLMFLIGLPLMLALFAFWIWMLISAVQNNGLSEGEKIAWVLVIVFLHWLGALLYYFIGHPKRITPVSPPAQKL